MHSAKRCLAVFLLSVAIQFATTGVLPAADPAAIDREMARCFNVAWKTGRYVPGLDHGAPPDISWDNIRYFSNRYVEWAAAPQSGEKA